MSQVISATWPEFDDSTRDKLVTPVFKSCIYIHVPVHIIILEFFSYDFLTRHDKFELHLTIISVDPCLVEACSKKPKRFADGVTRFWRWMTSLLLRLIIRNISGGVLNWFIFYPRHLPLHIVLISICPFYQFSISYEWISILFFSSQHPSCEDHRIGWSGIISGWG